MRPKIDKTNQNLLDALTENDRQGEIFIALFQMLISIVLAGFHLVSAAKNGWGPLNGATLALAIALVIVSLIRIRLTRHSKDFGLLFHVLSVVDGALIISLVVSYATAYQLPLSSTFQAPSVVFLIVYVGARVLKFSPLPIIIAGTTVLIGWFGIAFLAASEGNVAVSYIDFVSSPKMLWGAVLEMALGFVVFTLALVLAAYRARVFIAKTAHIEDLKVARDQNAEQLEVLNTLLNSSVDAIVFADTQGKIKRCNDAFATMFGYEAQDLVDKSANSLMSAINAELLREDVQRFLETGSARLIGNSFESEGMTSTGRSFPIEISITRIGDDVGSQFVGFIRDISWRRAVEEREKRAAEQLRRVVDGALDAIIIMDAKGKIVRFNPAAEEIFGFKKDDVVGKDMSDVIIPERYIDGHKAGLARFLKTGDAKVVNSRIEIQAVNANGDEFELELAIIDIEGPEGVLFVGYARDITERKQIEAKLLEAKEVAEAANRAKAKFLAMMSHEIRTPLNGVLGILNLLRDDQLSDAQDKLVRTAVRSGRSLLSIINDILDFSKLEAGTLDIEKAAFELDPMVDSVISIGNVHAMDTNVSVSYSIEEGVPPVLVGDQGRIRQVLLNLTLNAVKFTDAGSIKIRVSGADDLRNDSVRFEVIDTGIGIKAEDQEQLFSEFTMVEASRSRNAGGTGLGLAICKTLVEAMGGEISVSSEIGAGSNFSFHLPLECATDDMLSVPYGEASQMAEHPDFGKIRILVAEDNSTNQLVISSYLERMNCIADVVSNGKEAVSAVRRGDYDLVLMDISMPVMDGITATKAIRALPDDISKTPIVALTAYAMDEDRQRVLAAGMDGFVPKPISRIALANLISKYALASNEAESVSDPEALEFVDSDVLFGILSGMTPEIAEKLIHEFVDNIGAGTKSAIDAAKDNDHENLERATHSLKSVSGTFGAMELHRLCSVLNEKSRNEDENSLMEQTKEMVEHATQVVASVKDMAGDFYVKGSSE